MRLLYKGRDEVMLHFIDHKAQELGIATVYMEQYPQPSNNFDWLYELFAENDISDEEFNKLKEALGDKKDALYI